MPVDCLWDATHVANLTAQIATMFAEDDSTTALEAETPDFAEIARDMADEIFDSVACALHGEVCDCDDKRCTVESDMRDWLAGGSYEQRPYTIAELAAEWREYSSQG